MPRSILLLSAGLLWTFTLDAAAAPVTLTCVHDGASDSIQLVFDEEAKTAVAGDDPVSTANFTDTLITWGELDVRMNDWEFHKNYSLNRDTGELRMFGARKADNQDIWSNMQVTFHCAIAKKLF